MKNALQQRGSQLFSRSAALHAPPTTSCAASCKALRGNGAIRNTNISGTWHLGPGTSNRQARISAARHQPAPAPPASKDVKVLVGSSLPPWLPGPQGSRVSMATALGAAAMAALLGIALVAKLFEHKRTPPTKAAAHSAVGREAQRYQDDLVRVQVQVEEVQAAARDMQDRLRRQLKDRGQQLSSALQAAEALELELEAVKGVVRARETELAAVKTAAREEATAAKAALKESQRKVALLEAMVLALRDKLRDEEARTTTLSGDLAASKAQITAVEGQRLELVEVVGRLQEELASTQLRLQQADIKAEQLSEQVARLQAVEAELRDRLQAASSKAAAAEAAANSAEEQLLQVRAEAEGAQQEVAAMQAQVAAREGQIGELRDQLQAAEEAAEKLEAVFLETTARERREMEEAAKQLMDAYRSKQEELEEAKAQRAQVDAEALERQQRLEAELAEARASAQGAEQQLSQLLSKVQQGEEAKARMQEAAEQLEATVSSREAELVSTQLELAAAVSKAGMDSKERQEQLLKVQRQLQAELEAARQEAAATRARLLQLEAAAAGSAADDERQRREMEAAAKQLVEAYRSKQEELEGAKEQLSSVRAQVDAEALERQQRLEAELAEARASAQGAEQQLSQAALKAARDEGLQAEMREAAEQLAQLVDSKEAELQATREQLATAVSQVDVDAEERQQQLQAVQAQLEAQLQAAQHEAAATKAEMQQLKEEMEGVVLNIVAMASSRTGGSPWAEAGAEGVGAPSDGDLASAIVTLLPPALLQQEEGREGEEEGAPLEAPEELAQAQQELQWREEALRPQVARLEAELELQHDLVSARMPSEALRRVGVLEAELEERRAQLRAARKQAGGSQEAGAAWGEREARLRQEVKEAEAEVQAAFRACMGAEMQQRERNLRLELRDRKAELAAVLQGRATVQQRLQQLKAGGGAAAGAGGKVDVLQLVRERLQELERQREDAAGARLQQLAAREVELQEQLKEREESYAAGMQEAEQKLQNQIRELEAQWRVEAEARQAQGAQEELQQEQERELQGQAATTSADQVQVQVLELRRLQEEMAAQEGELRALREAYRQQLEAAQRAQEAAQEQVQVLQRQAADLQTALQEREGGQALFAEAASPAPPSTEAAQSTPAPPPSSAMTFTLDPHLPPTEEVPVAPSSNGVPPSGAPERPGEQPQTTASTAASFPPPPYVAPLPPSNTSGYRPASTWGTAAAPTSSSTTTTSSTSPNPTPTSTSTSTPQTQQPRPESPPSPPPAALPGAKAASLWGILQPSPPAPSTPAAAAPPAAEEAPGAAPPARAGLLFPAADEELGREVAALTDSFFRALGLAPRTPTAHRGPRDPPPSAWESFTQSANAATSTSAGGRSNTQAMRLLCGAAIIPHVDKVAKGGEDAYFITSAGLGAMGVADGVGGWAEDGVDPAEYSRTLMAQCCRAVETSRGQQAATRVLELAQTRTRVVGSATACVAMMRGGSSLEVANLGDSGLRVVRGGRCIFSTQVQEHEFNMPYQLADPKALPETDLAEDADVYTVEVEAGDLLVMGTDGLFDNMWEDEMLAIIDKEMQAVEAAGGAATTAAARQLAEALAAVASRNGGDSAYKSPWAVEAAQAGMGSLASRMFPRGGKMDDTTVVVAFVGPSR